MRQPCWYVIDKDITVCNVYRHAKLTVYERFGVPEDFEFIGILGQKVYVLNFQYNC